MRTMLATAAALGLLSLEARAADETWTVTEGQAARGTWHMKVEGDRITGSAETFAANGRKVTYNLAGTRAGANVTLTRIGATDGQACSYRGVLGAGGIAGSVMCRQGTQPWQVTKR